MVQWLLTAAHGSVKMQILFVVPYVPSLVRVRPFNLIRQLAERGHDVIVGTLWTNNQEREHAQELRQYCREVVADYLPAWRSYCNCLWALPRTIPLQAIYSWQPTLMARLACHVGRVDVVHVEHLRGTPFGLRLKAGLADSGRHVPVVWDSVDCITHLFRQATDRSASRLGRWLTRLEVRRTERREGWLVRQFDRVLVTSSAEKTALLSLIPDAASLQQVTVLTNGVDLDYFRPGDPAARQPETIVVSGKMSYHANVAMVVHFVNDILPLIWARHAGARLVIVGQHPPREIRKLSQDPRISVVGSVSDMRPFLQQATVAVAPLTYGAGIQNKVLEAMACATPVTASPQAISALVAQPGREVIVARDPATFAEEVVSLLDNPARQRCIGEAGRCFVERHHRWDHIALQLERTYDELIYARR
jgi:sugar transferase (PEP-CTERM/EpsH1 system associated)